MRTIVAAMAVAVFATGLAQAQIKVTGPNGQTGQLVTAPDSLDSAKRIPRDEARKMVAEHKAVFIDVRPKDQYDIGHIPGAINIPLAELPNHWKDLPVHKYLITYCA